MAPSNESIEAALKNAVQKIFHSKERDVLSVNVARSQAEADIHLKNGYLREGIWKEKSKAIVKTETVCLPLTYYLGPLRNCLLFLRRSVS
jgi:hypothetical protein